MPNLTPRDTYNPNQTVAPETASPGDYLNVRANPQEFGAQIGQGLEKVGQTLGQASDQAQQYAITAQGYLNDHAANMADMQYQVDSGKIFDELRTHTGAGALLVKDQYVQKLAALRTQVTSNLNPAAGKAFEALTARQTGYMIQNMNTYATDQFKGSVVAGNKAYRETQQDLIAQNYLTASDPQQRATFMAGITSSVNKDFVDPVIGQARDIPHTVDQNGRISFDQSTQDGQNAQHLYDWTLKQERGRAYLGVLERIATDPNHHNPTAALELYNKVKDEIPIELQGKIDSELGAANAAEKTNSAVENKLSDYRALYEQDIRSGVKTTSQDLFNSIHQQESSGATTNPSGTGPSTGPMQITPDTWATATKLGLVKPGENLNDPKANLAVGQRLTDYYLQKYNGDAARAAVAYFSGPGNVSTSGANPWVNDTTDKNGKTVSSYVSDVLSRLPQQNNGQVMSFPQWMSLRSAEFSDSVAKDIADQGFDITTQDQARTRADSRLGHIMSDASREQEGYKKSVMGFVGDPNHPVMSILEVENSRDPVLNKAWYNLDYFNRALVEKQVEQNATRSSKGYGADFNNYLQKILSGNVKDVRDVVTDPQTIGSDDHPLTINGYRQLEATLDKIKDNPGFARQVSGLINNAYRQITGLAIAPTISPAYGIKNFDAWLKTNLPVILDADKTPERFDPKNKDYLGNTVKPMTWTQATNFQMNNTTAAYASFDELMAAKSAGKITPDFAARYAKSHNWNDQAKAWLEKQKKAPEVPKPE